MIEAYAFLAAFTVQILVMSVLQPAWLTRYARAQATTFPAERFAQQYPGIDFSLTLERYLTRYRVLNTGIAVLGVLLLGWLFSYMRRPNWDDGPVEALVVVYFMMQALPLGLFALIGLKYSMVLKHSLLEGKRTAVLQRRGLFDFVSPFTVFLAVLSYFLFVAYVLYIEQNPFQGFHGYITIGAITLVYALNAFCVYKQLYGRKFNPFEPHAGRVRTIGLGVKACVYSCIAIVVFLSLNFTLVLLDLQRWEPFAQSVFFVITVLLSFMAYITSPRRPEADGFGPDGRLAP
jgi:hypothetical protein